MDKPKLAQISTFVQINLEFQDTTEGLGLAAALKVQLRHDLPRSHIKVNTVRQQIQISAPSSAKHEIYNAIKTFCAEKGVEWKPYRTYFMLLDTATRVRELPIKMIHGEFNDPKTASETLLATAQDQIKNGPYTVIYTVIGPDGIVAQNIFSVS